MIQHRLGKLGRLKMGAGLLCSSSWVHSPPKMCRDEVGSDGGLRLPPRGAKGLRGFSYSCKLIYACRAASGVIAGHCGWEAQ